MSLLRCRLFYHVHYGTHSTSLGRRRWYVTATCTVLSPKRSGPAVRGTNFPADVTIPIGLSASLLLQNEHLFGARLVKFGMNGCTLV